MQHKECFVTGNLKSVATWRLLSGSLFDFWQKDLKRSLSAIVASEIQKINGQFDEQPHMVDVHV